MAKDGKIIFIGCGTGRCGTASLVRLVEGCRNCACSHERRPLLPWDFDEKRFKERLAFFSNSTTRLSGDVSYAYLPYIERFIQALSVVKIICLERDRQSVVDSFIWKTIGRNHWYHHDGTVWAKDPVWDATFPKYDIADKRKAIGAYWDEYRTRVRRIAEMYPDNLCLFKTGTLNSIQGQKKVFDFLEISENDRCYQDHLKYNIGEPVKASWTEEAGYARMRRIIHTAENIHSVLPSQCRLILVDQEQIRDYIPAGCHVIPFLERSGVYYGPPSDDSTAIRELKRLRRTGSDFIVFAWPAFWWLDYYTGLNRYLRSKYRCLCENERIIVFDLRTVFFTAVKSNKKEDRSKPATQQPLDRF